MAITTQAAQAILADNFAPWVQALGLKVSACTDTEATLLLPYADGLVRVGGTICGQALMSAADTAMAIAISSALGGFKPMATVNQTVNFMRPISKTDVVVTARILKPGRTLVFGEVAIAAAGDQRICVHATLTYALAG